MTISPNPGTGNVTTFMRTSPPLAGIVESFDDGIVVLSPSSQRPVRRVLYVNSYGGNDILAKIKAGLFPAHHLWGCIELVRRGYEVAIAEPLPHFYWYRHPLPHDLKLFRAAINWLGKDGIIYCGHTLLYWLPLFRLIGIIRSPIISLTYARESLDFARAHTGIIALTPAAADQARKMAPRAKVRHLSWGADVSFFPTASYSPEWFLSCGIAQRDFTTLSAAASLCHNSLRVICPGLPPGLLWPSHVRLVDGGQGWNFEKSVVTFEELLREYYRGCTASLIILKADPAQKTAVGITNLIEAMAMARPVIVTRTGALPTEIDVERAGIGLYVPPEDPQALADAITTLANDRDTASSMSRTARLLCESHYNMDRFSSDLHQFFESF